MVGSDILESGILTLICKYTNQSNFKFIKSQPKVLVKLRVAKYFDNTVTTLQVYKIALLAFTSKRAKENRPNMERL